jgi:hypothetical protein
MKNKTERLVFFKNYDYAGSKDKAGPGEDLYQNMAKYKSVKDFLDKKHNRKKRKKAIAAVVLDLGKKLEQKKEKSELETIKDQLQKALPIEEEKEESTKEDELETMRRKKMLSEVHKATSVWQHRFSAVRKDNKGFYILKSDNESGSLMRVGDTLSDEAINMSPYWQILSINGNRIDLKPIGSNPFLTGVGAGGAKLTQYDIDVFTGTNEQKRLEHAQKKLEQGNATIDDVKYMLEGTVPTNMGPNGAQGGWYSATDTRANRGGRKGLKPEQIVLKDAIKLKELGFNVPVKALNGTLSPEKWNSWIDGSGDSEERSYVPKDLEKYVDFHKRMTEKGKYRYDQDSLDELKMSNNLKIFNEYWEGVIGDFTSMSKEEFKLKHPYKPDNLKSLIGIYERYKEQLEEKIKGNSDYLIEGEDYSSEQSVLKHIFNTERRVSIRNTIRLIEMSKEDPKYIKYLHDMIKLGGSDWFANEKVLNFFNLIDDVDGLKLGAEHLKDPTNIRYALGHLMQQGEADYVISKAEQNGKDMDLEVLDSVLNNIKKHYEADERKKYGRNDWVINYAKRHNLFDKLSESANSKSPHWKIDDIISTILHSFGPNNFWEPGDKELVEKYHLLYNKVRGK